MVSPDAFLHPLADVGSATIGEGTRIWQFCVVLGGAVIGRQCNICSHCLVEGGSSIGDRVTVKCGVQIWKGVHLADDVFVGPNVTFTNDKHPRSGNQDFDCRETHVGQGASIGGGAVILPGLRIGAGATVGAGAVVTRDVAAGTTVVGNPARPL